MFESFVDVGARETVRIKTPEPRAPQGWRAGNSQHADQIALGMLKRKAQNKTAHIRCTHPWCCPGRATMESIYEFARLRANHFSEIAINRKAAGL